MLSTESGLRRLGREALAGRCGLREPMPGADRGCICKEQAASNAARDLRLIGASFSRDLTAKQLSVVFLRLLAGIGPCRNFPFASLKSSEMYVIVMIRKTRLLK